MLWGYNLQIHFYCSISKRLPKIDFMEVYTPEWWWTKEHAIWLAGNCRTILAKGKTRACPGIEPGTSRTQSENHTSRPTSQLHNHSQVMLMKWVDNDFVHVFNCYYSNGKNVCKRNQSIHVSIIKVHQPNRRYSLQYEHRWIWLEENLIHSVKQKASTGLTQALNMERLAP